MNAIYRYNNMHQPNKGSGRKRSRGTATTISAADPHGISLPQGDETARFEQITLPMNKKRKTTSGLQAHSDVLSRSVATLSRGMNSLPSLLMPDISLGDSGELDVLTAMETVFPVVLVPRHGVNLPSGLNTPSSGYKSGNHNNMLFSAREQDITLTNPDRQLGLGDFPLFEEDLQFSLHSDEISNAENSHPLNLSQARNAPAPPHLTGQIEHLDASEEPLVPPEIGPLQLEPLTIQNPKEDHAPDKSHGPIQELASAKTLQKDKSISNASEAKVKTSVTFSDEPPRVYTPDANVGKRAEVQSLSTGRKRRSVAVQVDSVTELAPSEVRQCLNDTTDIVLEEFENRSSRKRSIRAKRESMSFAVPGFLSAFTNEITDAWKELTIPAFMATENVEKSNGTRPDRKRIGRVHAPSRTTKNPQAGAAHPSSPAQVLFEDEEDQILPVIPAQEFPSVNKQDSSVEIERTRGPLQGIAHDQFSVPSNSLEGRSNGGVQSSSGSLSFRRNNLDQVCALRLVLIPYHVLNAWHAVSFNMPVSDFALNRFVAFPLRHLPNI